MATTPFNNPAYARASASSGDAKPLPSAEGRGPAQNDPGKTGAPGSKESVPIFGGWRGGKKRKDGLKPGSPEAAAADKERDAKRKRDERAEASRSRDALPLPPGNTPDFHTPPPQIAPLAGIPVSPIGAPQIVPRWEAKDVEKIVRQFVDLTEELAGRAIAKRLNKARNILPADIVREIESDAHWSKKAKELISEGASELAARYLNESNISPELKPFLLIAIGAMEIAINHMQILKRLDALIAQQKTTKE